jgi:hypothetical protein
MVTEYYIYYYVSNCLIDFTWQEWLIGLKFKMIVLYLKN